MMLSLSLFKSSIHSLKIKPSLLSIQLEEREVLQFEWKLFTT